MNGKRNGTDAAAALLERPLTPRSLILSLLLGRDPPRARAALLVRWCGLFGVSENAARVALSRMVERGELTVQDATYELVGRVRARQAEQQVALAPPDTPWAGRWHVVVLGTVPRPAAQRQQARAALAGARFAARREGVWMRPDNLPLPAREVLGVDADCFLGEPTGDPEELAAALFSLDAARARAHRLLGALVQATDALDPMGPPTLAEAFLAGAATLQHLRRDPLLPPALVGPDSPGDALREAYVRFREEFSAGVRIWFGAPPNL